jgi:hypothetical protein
MESSMARETENVGIYFSVNGHILSDMVPVENGESYGNAIQHGGHYDFWKTLVPQNSTEGKFKSDGYDIHPRGRVVYLKKESIYRIYHDGCLVTGDLSKIKHHFGLDNANTKYERDEHYQCARCNPMYSEKTGEE